MAKMNKWGQIINSIASAFKGKTRKKKNDNSAAFDVFPSWFKSAIERSGTKDKETVEQKDNVAGVDSYIARKKSHKKFTPTTYNGVRYDAKTPFSSPDTEQQIVEPTNMGEFSEIEDVSVSYNDPVISTKPTETSKKLGLPRPGPSSFIQTARYNPATKRLNIAYTDGKIFPYENVSPELADSILKKKNYHSPGQTLLDTIFYGHGTTKGDEISDVEEGM